MEETIIALLNNNLRVIIPDFGAFIIRQKQPRIIVFNEFLRYNDGILIDFIVKTEGIDRDIAEQRVMDFAEDGSKLLASGRELIIEGLGSLRKDSSGKINFIEASEVIEIENKDTVEPEKSEVTEEKQKIPQAIEQEVPNAIEQEVPKVIELEVPNAIDQEVPNAIEQEVPNVNKQEVPIVIEQEVPQTIEQVIPQTIEPKIPKKRQFKAIARPKSKTKKAPAKGKTTRASKSLPKIPPADVPLQVIEPAADEPREIVEAAYAEPQEAVESVLAKPQEAVESARVEPREAVKAEVVEPHASVEAVPLEVLQISEPELIKTHQAVEPLSVNSSVELEPKATEPPKAVIPPPPGKPPKDDEPVGTADRPGSVSTNRILAWVLIILFVNAAILAWFVFRNKTKETPAGKTVTTMISDTLYDRLADSVRAAAMDSSIVYDEVPVEEDNPAVKSMTPGSRYYIVAGCFRDEVNADSLVTSLKLLGYKAEKFGKIGNLYAVCFASFDNKDKAVSELKKIREKIPSAWMTKF